MHRRSLLFSPALAATLARAPGLQAQGVATTGPPWPTRPIRIVVPFAAGSSGDLVPRLLAQPLAASLGQPIIVENRPGAGGTLAADAAAKAAPDGYTLTLSANQPHALSPAVYPSVPYDPMRDFTHIALLTEIPLVLAVAAQGPIRDLKQFIAVAQSMSGGARVGSNGNGSTAHVSMSLLGRLAGVEITHVPYRGSTVAALTDVIGGRIEAAMPLIGDVGHNERLRVLAIASPERLAGWPDVPTFREAGFPEMVVSVWFGVSGPAGLPDAIAVRMHREIQAALVLPEVAGRLEALGSSPNRGLSRADYTAFVAHEGIRWREAARAGGIRAE